MTPKRAVLMLALLTIGTVTVIASSCGLFNLTSPGSCGPAQHEQCPDCLQISCQLDWSCPGSPFGDYLYCNNPPTITYCAKYKSQCNGQIIPYSRCIPPNLPAGVIGPYNCHTYQTVGCGGS